MNDLDREHVLQKIVAVTGFLFALLILPVAQYLLVHNQDQPAAQEQGTVAGVSTDNTVTNAVVTDPAACVAQRTQDLADLQKFYDGELANLSNKHDPLIKGYQTALSQTPTSDTANTAALSKLIADEQAAYNAEKAPIQTAVDNEAKNISSRNCGETSATATATPAPAATP